MLSKSRLPATLVAFSLLAGFATQVDAATVATASVRLGDQYAPFTIYPFNTGYDQGSTRASVAERAVGAGEGNSTWIVDASGGAVVGSNGTSGLGLMKLNLDVFYGGELALSTPPYPDEAPAPGSSHFYFGNATATWHDTLHLPSNNVGPAYMKFLVTGGLSVALQGVDPALEHLIPRKGVANATLSMQSYDSNVQATVSAEQNFVRYWIPGSTTDYVPATRLDDSFTADGFQSYSHVNGGFSGIVLLPVYSQGDAAVRPFTLQGSVNVAAYNAHAEADFGHTISFLGVTDASGNPITGASFESGLTPAIVPEPSTAVLVGVMALTFGAWRVTRRRR